MVSIRQSMPTDQIMSSRINIDMSTFTLKDMLDDSDTVMECSISKSFDTLKFVSETRLAKLTTPEAVKEVLQERKSELKLSPYVDLSELAEFFSQKAFKVFAILATNQGFDLMEHFWRNNFQNDMLPVRKRMLEDGTNGWVIESCNKDVLDDTKVCEVFRSGSSSPWGPNPYRIKQFCENWQWPFVPPVFVESTFRYKFPEETRLPFTRDGETKDSQFSLYSYVQEKSIHIDHLPRNLVR
jgi:hypothetical protein